MLPAELAAPAGSKYLELPAGTSSSSSARLMTICLPLCLGASITQLPLGPAMRRTFNGSYGPVIEAYCTLPGELAAKGACTRILLYISHSATPHRQEARRTDPDHLRDVSCGRRIRPGQVGHGGAGARRVTAASPTCV